MSGLIAARSTREATPIQMAASKASSMYIASLPQRSGRPRPSVRHSRPALHASALSGRLLQEHSVFERALLFDDRPVHRVSPAQVGHTPTGQLKQALWGDHPNATGKKTGGARLREAPVVWRGMGTLCPYFKSTDQFDKAS